VTDVGEEWKVDASAEVGEGGAGETGEEGVEEAAEGGGGEAEDEEELAPHDRLDEPESGWESAEVGETWSHADEKEECGESDSVDASRDYDHRLFGEVQDDKVGWEVEHLRSCFSRGLAVGASQESVAVVSVPCPPGSGKEGRSDLD